MGYESEMIEDYIEDLKDTKTDLLVLCLIHSRAKPMLKTRIQKEALIYNQTYTKSAHEPYYFGGYSDDVDESYSSLSDIGLLRTENKGYILSDFGNAIATTLSEKDDETIRRSKLLNQALAKIDDKSLVAITYSLFPSLAEKSIIAESLSPLIDKMKMNNKPLRDWTPEEFIECIREGTPITVVA